MESLIRWLICLISLLSLVINGFTLGLKIGNWVQQYPLPARTFKTWWHTVGLVGVVEVLLVILVILTAQQLP